MITAYERVKAAFENAGCAPTDRGDRFSAPTPGHSAGDKGCHVKQFDGGVTLSVYNDDRDRVMETLGLTMADLFDHRETESTYSDGRKFYRHYRKDGKKAFYPDPRNPAGNALYRVEHLPDDLDVEIYVCEGEKDCNIAAADGLVAVSQSGGAGQPPNKADWKPLRGRPVTIVADIDAEKGGEPGRSRAEKVYKTLASIASSVRIVHAAQGNDLGDHIAADLGVDDLVVVDTSHLDTAPGGSDAKDEKLSAATTLVYLARERYELGVTVDGEPFAVAKDGPHIARMLRGGKTGLRAELASEYFKRFERAAPQQALADALLVLEGWARTAEPVPVHLRVAEHDGVTYIDLGDTQGRMIRISGGRWELVDTAPVLFRRTNVTGALPEPVRGGDLTALWETVNVDEEDRPLVLGWLLHALVNSETPCPILSLFSEQGSGKSIATRILVSMVDPSPVPLRKEPKDPEQWVTAASGSRVVGIDNLSWITPWLSDSMCRAVTGDGDLRRALFTDGDLVVFSFRRALIVNGIDIGSMRPDYAERSLIANLRRITGKKRRGEREILDRAARQRPEIFGGLLDLAAKVKAVLPSIQLDSAPRMADFAYTLAAVDQVLGTEGLARYLVQSENLSVDSLEIYPFIVEMRQRIRTEFDGTAAELLARVTPQADGWRAPKGWPKDARTVTGMLRRTAPALRSAGWTVRETPPASRQRSLTWTLTPPPPSEREAETAPTSPTSPSPHVNATKYGGDSGGEVVSGSPSSPPDGDRGEAPHLFPTAIPTSFTHLDQGEWGSGDTGGRNPFSPATDSAAAELGTPDGETALFTAPAEPVRRLGRAHLADIPVGTGVCGVCGGVMHHPASIAYGLCQKCLRLQEAQRQDEGQVADYDEDQTPPGDWDAA